MLDDGRITDSQGRTVDFKNTIIILTSNIGAQTMLSSIEESGTITPACEAMVAEELKASFRPEFLNRLDETILFRPLARENLYAIIDLMLADVNARIRDRELTISLTDAAKDHILEAAYDPIYGARPLKRYLQKTVETMAAKLILEDAVAQDGRIVIDVKDGALCYA